MTTTLFDIVPSPVGDLLLESDGHALTGLHFHAGRTGGRSAAGAGVPSGWRCAPDVLAPVTEQLGAYFAGKLRSFDVPLAPAGTPFQRLVWDALVTIPYGATLSYGELAETIGRPGSARSVGAANGRNPIAIVVPCHRVVGADGTLTGYAGGLDAKRTLLDIEGATT